MSTQAMEVKERPIVFSGDMVNAIIAHKKTMTRRVVVPQPHQSADAMRDIPYTNEWYAAYIADQSENSTEYRPLGSDHQHPWKCPYGKPGDRLWVRESWAPSHKAPQCQVSYKADGRCYGIGGDGSGGYMRVFHGWLIDSKVRGKQLGNTLGRSLYQSWKSPRYMPRWASRLSLEVEWVRVERLQDIRVGGYLYKSDVQKEGCPFENDPAMFGQDEAAWFMESWDALNANRGHGWDTNPFVWVIEFKRVDK